MTEVWRIINGVWGYEASNEGRIRSVDRVIAHGYRGHANRLVRGKILRPSMGTKYLMVSIDGTGHSVHTLVLLAFEGPRPFPEAEGRHLDGSKTNNRADNLTWGTPHQNQMDRFDHGTACAGEDNYRAIQTEQQVLRIMELRGKGLGPKDIAETLGCERAQVKSVIYGMSWNWLTGLPRRRYRKASNLSSSKL